MRWPYFRSLLNDWQGDMAEGDTSGFMHLALSGAIRTTATRVPDKVVIEGPDGSLTSRQLVDRMNRLGVAATEGWGLRSGDIVALIAPNRHEYFEVVAGLSDHGIIVATLNPRMTPAELAGILADCNPAAMIVDPAAKELAQAARASGRKVTFFGDDYEALLQRAASRSPRFTPPETSSFSICYTSGTTGNPKGVLLPHRSRALVALASATEYQCFGMDDRFLALAPLYHGAGFAFAYSAMAFGGTCVLFNRTEGDVIVDRLGAGDITGVFMVPTHFKRIFDLPEATFNGYRKRHGLRTIISNAASLAPRFKELTAAYIGDGLLYEAYGSTEAGIVTTIRPKDILRKPESVGTPFIHMEVEIRREDGSLCAPGETGELFSRGPYTFNGYLNLPEATEETLRDGWVTVQDLASRDEEGFITIVGRTKDMVISGGVNIYPSEIEAVIATHPLVSEVAVVGVPDEEWGERLHAFIVGRSGGAPSDQEIITLCRAKLSGNKVPKSITIIDELPRSVSGKILKRELRQQAQVEGQPNN